MHRKGMCNLYGVQYRRYCEDKKATSLWKQAMENNKSWSRL